MVGVLMEYDKKVLYNNAVQMLCLFVVVYWTLFMNYSDKILRRCPFIRCIKLLSNGCNNFKAGLYKLGKKFFLDSEEILLILYFRFLAFSTRKSGNWSPQSQHFPVAIGTAPMQFGFVQFRLDLKGGEVFRKKLVKSKVKSCFFYCLFDKLIFEEIWGCWLATQLSQTINSLPKLQKFWPKRQIFWFDDGQPSFLFKIPHL